MTRPWAVAALLLSGAFSGPLATLRAAAEIPPASPKTSPSPPTPKPPSDPSPAPATETSPPSSSPEKQNPAARWDSVADLEGDALLSKAADLGLLDVKLDTVYQNYLRDLHSASDLEASGMGENHPDVRAVKAGLDVQRRQLMDGVNQLKENAESVRKLTADRLAATAIPVSTFRPIRRRAFSGENPPMVFGSRSPGRNPWEKRKPELSSITA